jgi:hypothetical protein
MRDRKRWAVPYPPGEVLLALYRHRGPVIDTGVGGLGYTYLLGPEANKFVFANADAFSWREAFAGRVAIAPRALNSKRPQGFRGRAAGGRRNSLERRRSRTP